VTSSVYFSQAAAGISARDTFDYSEQKVGLLSRAPFDAPGGSDEEQYRQHQQRSGGKRGGKRPEKTHPPVGTAKSRWDAQDDVDDCFEHGLVGQLLSRLGGPLPDWLA